MGPGVVELNFFWVVAHHACHAVRGTEFGCLHLHCSCKQKVKTSCSWIGLYQIYTVHYMLEFVNARSNCREKFRISVCSWGVVNM